MIRELPTEQRQRLGSGFATLVIAGTASRGEVLLRDLPDGVETAAWTMANAEAGWPEAVDSDVISPGTWERLRARMARMRVVEEPDFDDPDPLI